MWFPSSRVAMASLALAVAGLAFALHQGTQVTAQTPPREESIVDTLRSWGKPDVTLFLTGHQHGYIEPCGCTGLANQKGGLARRDTLLTQIREQLGWDVLPLDAGNQVRRTGPQAAIKLQMTANALRAMKYAAVGFADDDLRTEFGSLISQVLESTDDLGRSDLFVCANVNILDSVATHRVLEEGGIRLGVTSVLGPKAVKKVPQGDIQISEPVAALKRSLGAMKAEGCSFTVVLAAATDEEARTLAKQVPGIDLIVVTDGAGEPRFPPEQVNGTTIVQTGTKGMYVGVVGLFNRNGKIQLRYQRCPLDAKLADSRRMLDSMAEYQKTLEEIIKREGFAGLGIAPKPHFRDQFVGSETCGDCHTQAYEKWLETPHHHATQSIAEPTERSEIHRHFDPECLSCHVTGWEPQAYLPYKSGYVDLQQSAHLHGNGCENCHGPGKSHVAAESDGADEATIKRLRQQMRLPLEKAEERCAHCHDGDNSPEFHKPGAFEKYWEAVAHPWKD